MLYQIWMWCKTNRIAIDLVQNLKANKSGTVLQYNVNLTLIETSNYCFFLKSNNHYFWIRIFFYWYMLMKTENVPDRSKIISITMAFSLSWIIRERCKKRSDMTETIVLISTFNRGFSISCHFYRSITLKVSGFLMFLGGLKKTSSMEWFYKDFRFYILLLYEILICNAFHYHSLIKKRKRKSGDFSLTLPVPNTDKQNFYFRSSLWFLKRFYEGLERPLKFHNNQN